ncbi:ClpP/crotonase-like domain-containing protein [Suillus subaureus]|uniref:ClpP/crotonase-like domain-containing protein n=1 Tax=Suillus subaureus TaxID=48587 RepID=A0A9P7E9J9_9AGAM|nr:ClpP/crotonase-like domain-containing protein [Suillus subaureus]KAG1814726.1 ClpP/crotonase-like domain-containing protein [Suillus subaureus]
MASLESKYIKISSPAPHVLLLELNRQPVNAFSTEFLKEYECTFDALSRHPDDIRAVVLSSAFPNMFSAGIDWTCEPRCRRRHRSCTSRISYRDDILDIQHAVAAPERCPIPVIAAVHGIVIGLGIDIISACDVRYAASDAKFSIKALDMGLAADAGTLAYLQKITGNTSLAHELAYTARTFSSDEAEKLGLVSRIVQGGRDAVVAAALQLAKDIASKSPVAVSGTKRLLLHARDHSVAENLEYTATWNSAALQATDLQQSVKAGMTKSKESSKFLSLRPKL